MKQEPFDFIEEVKNKKINVDIIREMEIETLVNIILSEVEQEDLDDEETILYDVVVNNFNDYLSFRDDLFLERLVENYSEPDLKYISVEAERLEVNKIVESKSKKILINGKEYNIH